MMEPTASRDFSDREQTHNSSRDLRDLQSRTTQPEPGTRGKWKVPAQAAGASTGCRSLSACCDVPEAQAGVRADPP